MKRVATITILLSVVFVKSSDAQGLAFKWKEAIGDWHAGINLSTTRYCGDLSDRYNIRHLQLSWAAEGHVRYRFTEFLCARGDVGFYGLRGDQQYTTNKDNNLRFRTINPSMLVSLQANIRSIDYNQNNVPHIWIGGGITYLNPKTDFHGVEYSLPLMHTENIDYTRLVGQLVIGVGMPFTLNNKSQLRLEARYNYILSDYVDDVSDKYIGPLPGLSIEQALADRRYELGLTPNPSGTKRGNPFRNDGYFALSLQYAVKFKTH